MPASHKFPHLPAQVYLDSSDFSALTDSKRDEEWRVDMLSRLREGIASGAIQCRFSAAHVIEASPISLDVAAPGVERLRLVRELCGRHAFRYFADVLTQEMRARAGLDALKPTYVHADDGRWMPGLDDFAADLKKDKEASLAEVRLLPRAMRRRLLTKDGAGLNIAVDREAAARAARQLGNKYPGFERCMPAFLKFYTGVGSAQDVEDEFLRPLADPSQFSTVYLANFDEMAKLVTWLRELGAKNVETFTVLRGRWRSIAPAWTEDDSAFMGKHFSEFREALLCGRNEQRAIVKSGVCGVDQAATLLPS